MDKETIKEFLKPSRKKLLIFISLIIISISILYILYKISGYYLMCDPLSCSDWTIFMDWLDYKVGSNIFIIILLFDYIFTCMIISLLNNFKIKK